MTVEEILTELKKKAAADPAFLEKLLMEVVFQHPLGDNPVVVTEVGVGEIG